MTLFNTLFQVKDDFITVGSKPITAYFHTFPLLKLLQLLITSCIQRLE